jgi:hypothetical protein
MAGVYRYAPTAHMLDSNAQRLCDLVRGQANDLPVMNRTSGLYSAYGKLPTIALRTSGLGQSDYWLGYADRDWRDWPAVLRGETS